MERNTVKKRITVWWEPKQRNLAKTGSLGRLPRPSEDRAKVWRTGGSLRGKRRGESKLQRQRDRQREEQEWRQVIVQGGELKMEAGWEYPRLCPGGGSAEGDLKLETGWQEVAAQTTLAMEATVGMLIFNLQEEVTHLIWVSRISPGGFPQSLSSSSQHILWTTYLEPNDTELRGSCFSCFCLIVPQRS